MCLHLRPSVGYRLPHGGNFAVAHPSNHQLGNIQTLDHFYADARGGHLPAVSWINPDAATSEHPAARLTTGQTYVTGLINALMKSRD